MASRWAVISGNALLIATFSSSGIEHFTSPLYCLSKICTTRAIRVCKAVTVLLDYMAIWGIIEKNPKGDGARRGEVDSVRGGTAPLLLNQIPALLPNFDIEIIRPPNVVGVGLSP